MKINDTNEKKIKNLLEEKLKLEYRFEIEYEEVEEWYEVFFRVFDRRNGDLVILIQESSIEDLYEFITKRESTYIKTLNHLHNLLFLNGICD